MAPLLSAGATFNFTIGDQEASFKVQRVNGDDFTATLESDVSGVFGADLELGLTATYSAGDKILTLAGKANWNNIEMDFENEYDLSKGSTFDQKLNKAVQKDGTKPNLKTSVSKLFGDTGSILKDVDVNGSYNAKAKAFDWSGNLTLDFTPDDSENHDEINVTLSNLSFQRDPNNSGKKFLRSADLSLSQGGDLALTLGGVSIAPTNLQVSYTDTRAEATDNKFTKSFALTLAGNATWGKETTDTNDDFKLGLSGAGTYKQYYTTAPIAGVSTTTNATKDNPVKFKGGLTQFDATAATSTENPDSIDLGPLSLLPKQASISYAADLDKNYALWNVGGQLGLQAGFLPDVALSLGQPNAKAETVLPTILAATPTTYPTAGGWSLGSASADLTGSNGQSLVDLGLISVDGVKLSLVQSDSATGPDLSALGFYKFINNNTAQPTTAPATLTQDQGKAIKLDVNGVKFQSSKLVETLKGTSDTISTVLSPVKPLVDFFTQEVTIFDGVDQALRDPIVSFLESVPGNQYVDGKVEAVEFVDAALAAKSLLKGQPYTSITPGVKAAENVFTVLDSFSKLSNQMDSEESTNLGNYSFSYPLNKLKPQPAAAKTPDGSGAATSTPPLDTAPPALADFQANGKIGRQLAAYQPFSGSELFRSNTRIQFPALSDPIGYISKYFTDGSADLFKVDLDFGFSNTFDVSVPVPAFPVVKVGIQGGVDASLKTSIAATLDVNAIKRLKDDFSISSLGREILNGTGIDLEQTKAEFGANLGLSVGVDAYIASLKLVGGLEGRLTIQPVLMQNSTTKRESQILRLGDAAIPAKPAYIQPGVKLGQLKLEIEQNLDNVMATGLDQEQAYAKNTWLVSISFDTPNNLSASVRRKLGDYVLDRLNLIELDSRIVKDSYENIGKSLKIDLHMLSDEAEHIYAKALSALKRQLENNLSTLAYSQFSEAEFKEILGAICNTVPRSIEYTTIDASDTNISNGLYQQRMRFLQNDGASKVLDGTKLIFSKADKQTVNYMPTQNSTASTSNFYVPRSSEVNSGNKANDPELVVRINGKLNQPFNEVYIDLLPTTGLPTVNGMPEFSQTNIKVKDSSDNWQTIGVLTKWPAAVGGVPSLSLQSAINQKAVELFLVYPRSSDANQANYKLILNLSNENREQSNTLAQAIIDKAKEGELEIAFDVTGGYSQAVAISDARIVQGGAISIGAESSNSKLLTNAIAPGQLVSSFGIYAQPTDILNPAEISYARNAFGGVPAASVSLGTAFSDTKTFDSLAIINAINRVTIKDSLSDDVRIKSSTSTRQTVDPVNGDTYLSYIDASSGNLAVAKKAANSSVFQSIKIFSTAQTGQFKIAGNAPDLVAYNGQVMGAAEAAASGKLARYLITSNGNLKKPVYTLQINSNASLPVSTPGGPIRLGLIAERDVDFASTSNQLTVGYAYRKLDGNGSVIMANKNLKSTNYDSASQILDLKFDGTNGTNGTSFSNWDGVIYNHGGSVVDVDFMEFATEADLRAHLGLAKGSTQFSLEGSKDAVKIWNTSAAQDRRYQYDLNIPGISPSTLSVVSTKQSQPSDTVPAFVENWKGTSPSTDRTTAWKDDSGVEKNLSFAVTGSTTATTNNPAREVVYNYIPYNNMLTGNIANLQLRSYQIAANNSTASQNTNGAQGGLAWTWDPVDAKAGYRTSNVDSSKAESTGVFNLGENNLVALERDQGDSIMSALKGLAKDNYVNISKNTFQLLPRSDGNYALSGIAYAQDGTTNTKAAIISVDQLPNYKTGLLTTKAAFDTPSSSQALLDSFFNGTYSFVNQGEWAPLGIVATPEADYVGDLRDPVEYSKQGGLLGQYFNNIASNRLDFKDDKVADFSRVDSTIDFDWGSNSPLIGLNSDHFAVRWTGYIKAPIAGHYTFKTNTDDMAWLKIGDTTVINNWQLHQGFIKTGQISLEANKLYPIDFRYYENTGDAAAKLSWQLPDAASDVIVPSNALFSNIPSKFAGLAGPVNIGKSRFYRSSSNEYVLRPGQQITSPNAKYSLDMQENGELILFQNTLKGRVVLWNFNDFQYGDGSPLVGGHCDIANNSKRAVPGTSLVIKQRAKSKSGNQEEGYYLSLEVPKDNGTVSIPLNPDKSVADNIVYRRVSRADDGTPLDSSNNPIVAGASKDLGWIAVDYDWRAGRGWGVSNTDEGNDIFGYFQLDDNGNLSAYDSDSSSPNRLFYLENWANNPLYLAATNANAVALTDATPYGFNGLVSDIVRSKPSLNSLNLSSGWDRLAEGNGLPAELTQSYDDIRISPDLNSISPFVFGQDSANPNKSGTSTRDILLNGSGGFSALLAKGDGLFSRLSDAITWGPSAPPANQLKSMRFTSPVEFKPDGSSIDDFIRSIWTGVQNKSNAAAEFDLLNGAETVRDNDNVDSWLTRFKAKYASLRALSVLPAVSSKSYFSVPTIELTPRSADLGEVYKTYASDTTHDQPYIQIDTNFKLDAFVKVVASFAWWDAELLKATYPLLNETWSFKTGYGAGGPVYGTQQIHLDQDHDLIADRGEISSVNTNAAFSLDLSPLSDSLRMAPESPRNTIWNGSSYVYSPLSDGIDFRSGLLVVQPNGRDSVFDAATGLANNKVYISVPDSEYLVANIWTSLKYSSVLDYQFFSQDATAAAKADFYAESKLRYSSDPYFVTKLTPIALEGLLNRRLAGIPAAYVSSAGDTFDAYNGMVAQDRSVADQAFGAFRFTSRLTFVLETVERLLNRLKPDTVNWGQTDSYADRRSLISSYQLIPYLAMAAEGLLDPYYSQVLKLAATGQSEILNSLDAGTFRLDLSNKEHLQLLLNFAALTVPNSLGQSQSPFGTNGRLDLTASDLSSWLGALKLDAVASSLTDFTAAYDTTAQRFYQADPRLLTAALAPVKRDALKADGLIDAILQSSLPPSASSGFGTMLETLLQTNTGLHPAIQDSTRIASITQALEDDLDSNGQLIHHQGLRVHLNHAAPPGGTIVALTYGGQAKYGVDYTFEGNALPPKYVFIPFDETSVVIPVAVLPQTAPKDWTLTVGIEEPSSSYNVSADMNKVLLRYHAADGKLSLSDNNSLVRLSDDPQQPHKLVSASPDDHTIDYQFFRNSRVVGVEAEGEAARTLQYYVNSENPLISIYSIGQPPAHPTKSGTWILVDDAAMQVYAGDVGAVDIVQYFNADTGVYGYAPANEVDHAYQGSAWQNQGVVFSLGAFNRDIAEAIGTITPVASVGTSFASVSEHSPLLPATLTNIQKFGFTADQVNADVLHLKPQIAAHQNRRTSMVLNLASMADRLWDPGQGLTSRFVSSFNVQNDGSVRDASYNAISGSGARFYSLHSSLGSLDTVVLDVADGIDDADGQFNNQVDLSTATAFAASFNPHLQVNNGVVQYLDPSQATTPLAGGVKVTLNRRGQAVQDLRYTLLAAGETVADLLKLSSAELEARSRLIFSSLESVDVTLLPSEKASLGSAFSQTIPLTNGQQLVLLERSGRGPTGTYHPIALPPAVAASPRQELTSPGGLSLTLETSTSVSRLADFLARDQQHAPVIDFTGLDGQAVGFEVELAREAVYNTTVGFYRVIDNQGSVRDPLSGAVISPGDPAYAKAALAATNRPALRTFAVANSSTGTFKDLNVQESALLAPYGQFANGTTLFAFADANPDHCSHFKSLGQLVFGFEDQLMGQSDFDYDDMVLAVRNPTLLA